MDLLDGDGCTCGEQGVVQLHGVQLLTDWDIDQNDGVDSSGSLICSPARQLMPEPKKSSHDGIDPSDLQGGGVLPPSFGNKTGNQTAGL